jgi:hypothetical protein
MSNATFGLGLFVLTAFHCAAAQDSTVVKLHDSEDQHWATKTGLDAGDVRAIRMAAGVSDSSYSRILNIDANTLQHGRHILFVEGQPCVNLHVLERLANGFVEVWSLSALPRPISGVPPTTLGKQRGICPLAPLLPRARATTEDQIVLEVPVLLDPFQRTLPPYTYVFAWDGSRYALLENEQ